MPRFPVLLLFFGLAAAAFLVPAPPVAPPRLSADPHDWPMYGRDVVGTRFNPAEQTLSPANVGQLEEKWRFPPAGSTEKIGAVHATPIVVDGCVYFGTVIGPSIYKLAPDGKVAWKYRNPDAAKPAASLLPTPFSLPTDGYITSPLVTEDTAYAVDLGGWIVALDRETGKERWKLSTRTGQFPGAHPSNCIFAAPILAEGKLIVAGGGFEHGIGADPKHECCDGRGFVAALDPLTGAALWKYDVGPEPKPLDPPVAIEDSYGKHVFRRGPSTSSVWCVPSYDAESRTLFFGTDAHNAPRQPTPDDPRLYTKHSCAVIAVDARSGAEKWVTQVNPDDVWNYALRGYDPKTGRYKDQSIGDTPKIFTIDVAGKPTKVVGCGCKNGVFYVLDAATGQILRQTPQYAAAPADPPNPPPHPRTLALPGLTGGLQTGCATDGRSIFTNGMDHSMRGTAASRATKDGPPTGGRVVCLSLDLGRERWRHERPKVAAVGGTEQKPAFTNVGDSVGSGIALANGVAYFTTAVSNRLVAVDMATGRSLKEIPLGPVWCGPSVSRGQVYVGLGNILFAPGDPDEAYYPKSFFGAVACFGLPEGARPNERGE